MTRRQYPLPPDDPAWTRLDKMLAESDAYYAEHPDELEAANQHDYAADRLSTTDFTWKRASRHLRRKWRR